MPKGAIVYLISSMYVHIHDVGVRYSMRSNIIVYIFYNNMRYTTFDIGIPRLPRYTYIFLIYIMYRDHSKLPEEVDIRAKKR